MTPTPTDWTTLTPGERVKITLEGEVRTHNHTCLDVKVQGSDYAWTLSANVLTHATIERLPREWKVGDRCEWADGVYEVMAPVRGSEVPIWGSERGYYVVDPADLRPLPDEAPASPARAGGGD